MANAFLVTPVYDRLMAEWSTRPVTTVKVQPMSKRERHRLNKQTQQWADEAIASVTGSPVA